MSRSDYNNLRIFRLEFRLSKIKIFVSQKNFRIIKVNATSCKLSKMIKNAS